MDTFVIAMSRYRRRKYDETLELCNQMLTNNPGDQAAWLLKCNSLVRKQYIDDIEIDEEGVGDVLLDENSVASIARPGTSFQRPNTQSGNNQMIRPMSKSGRPISGYQRMSSQRPTTSSQGNRVETALKGNRPGTNRPITSGGRYLRLGTASLQSMGEQFIAVDKLNMKQIAKKKGLAKSIFDYLLYVEHNPRKALELAAEATQLEQYNDWWWKVRLGKCYYMLGLYREAEKQFQSALKTQDMIKTHLELAKVYVRLDQPNSALDIFLQATNKYKQEISLILGTARIYDMLNDSVKAIEFYRRVLFYESCNFEAVACIASHHFYEDQPEVALRFYKRLVQLGISNAELWNNMALCCFYDGQYDLFWSCFEKALGLADDSNKADIWYNISQVFINVADIDHAYQALKLAINIDSHHAESYNNLGVIEIKREKFEAARYELGISQKEGEHLFEPFYNGALLAYKTCDYQESFKLVKQCLQIYPEFQEAKELLKTIEDIFNIM